MANQNKKSAPAARVLVIAATHKGAWLYHADAARKTWRADGPHFLGHIINHLMLDPRDGKTLLAAAKTGHLGPTIFRSINLGRTWKEATRPPAFAPATDAQTGRAVDHTFWLTPGHISEPNVWYAGTSPQGLFRTAGMGAHRSENTKACRRQWRHKSRLTKFDTSALKPQLEKFP